MSQLGNMPQHSAGTGTAPQGHIAIDPAIHDNDSAYGDDLSTYTASLSSSVLDYQYENGRRYHAYQSGRYLYPNDESENDRLDMMHHLQTIILGGRLHLAPLKNPQRILDLGTGTGIWCIQMGDDYPSAEIIGTDLSPTQPQVVPPNVKFEVDDIEQEWTHKPFDYIHSRYMASSIKDWPKLVQTCYRFLKPGGLVEFQDYDIRWYSEDGSLKPESSANRFCENWTEAVEKMGLDPCPGSKLEKWVREAGFENIEVRKFKVPLGRWPKEKSLKEQGTWNLVQALDGMEAFAMAPFTRVLGWKPEEVQVMVAKVKQELTKSSLHIMYDCYVVTGRKPEEGG